MLSEIPAAYRSRRIIVAAKIALFVALAGFTLLALLWAFVFMVIGSLGARHLWMHLGAGGFEVIAIMALASLAALRAADVLLANRA